MALGLILDQLDHGLFQPLAITEIHQLASTVGKHLLGVPIGCGNDGFAHPHGIGQGAARDLLLVQVRSDVHVTRANKFTKLGQADEAVVEDDMFT